MSYFNQYIQEEKDLGIIDDNSELLIKQSLNTSLEEKDIVNL